MKPSAEVICRELGDAAVLIHLGTNEIFELNPTGYRVWQLLQDGLDRAEIERRMVQEFEVEPDRLRREIGDLLATMAARNLILDR